MICDYYLVRGRELAVEDLYRRGGAYEYRGGFNPRAMIALACGVGVALIGLAVPALRWLYALCMVYRLRGFGRVCTSC